jgi:putative ABC transport system permease protein
MPLLWLRGLLRTAVGRTAATSLGIALAVSLLSVLVSFVVAAGSTMTARAISNVPVDWQIELAAGADRLTVEKALSDSRAARIVRAVEYAKVDGFSAATGGTEQVTGAGQVLGLPTDYQAIFPHQIELMSGSSDGPLLFMQTAANLHAGVGDTIAIHRPGMGMITTRIAGIVAMPNIDSMFQVVGIPPGMAPQSPPDNVLILPLSLWHELFDAQKKVRPDSIRTQLHIGVDRTHLPNSPQSAYTAVREMANNLEARVAGSAAVASNLAARLDAVRSDALYAKVLFLFIGSPGIVLAVLVTIAIADAGATRRLDDLALLKIRGASLSQSLLKSTIEAALVGFAGSVCGIGFALLVLKFVGIDIPQGSFLFWVVFFGLAVALAAVLLPATKAVLGFTVAKMRSVVDRSDPAYWEQLWLDVGLLIISGIVFWRAQGTGYQIVLASEGVAQTTVNYETFLAPLALWAGLGLLWVRLVRRNLIRMPSLLRRILTPFAGNLSSIIGASLSRQATRISRGTGLLTLATAFAVSVAIFNFTYDRQASVDAELTNGADVNVTGTTADPAGAKLRQIRDTAGITAAEPMMHRYAYVGSDLQDIYGIDPQAINRVTTIVNTYFVNRNAARTLQSLAGNPDGVLASEETVQDFQLQLGDTLNLRLQFAGDHQYHSVPFRFVGTAREFPTAPKDSFLVVNSAYLAKVTGSAAEEIVLARSDDPPTAASNLHRLFVTDPVLKVTALGDVRSLISSTLTSVDLRALTQLELCFGFLLIIVAAGLVLGLGFAERHRTFAILAALGAKPHQLGAFLHGEAVLVTVAGLVFGLLTGVGIASMLVVMLAGVFDPPPETIAVPIGYILVIVVGAIAAATAVTMGFEQAHRRSNVVALKTPDGLRRW